MAQIAYSSVTETSFVFYVTGLDTNYNHGGRTAHWEVKQFLASEVLYSTDETLADQISRGANHTVTGLSENTTYVITCTITNTYSGTVTELDAVTVTTSASGYPPHPPVAEAEATDTTITVTATPYPGDTVSSMLPYVFVLYLASDLTYDSAVASSGLTDSPYTFTGLTPGTDYVIATYARNYYGTSAAGRIDIRTTGGSNAYVYSNGSWKPASAKIYRGGAFKDTSAKIYTSQNWKG